MTSFNLFYEPSYELKSFMGPSFRHPVRLYTTAPPSRPSKPKLDLHENTDKNLITATLEFPGVKKEDIQLSVQNNVLTVSAENKSSSEHEENGYAIRERRYGNISRSIPLPQGIREEDISASMADGVLTITWPKSSPEQQPKRITIS